MDRRNPLHRGATLAEVIFGILIFSIFVFGVLGTLGQSAHLNLRDKEVNQVSTLTQGYLEQTIMLAHSKSGYYALTHQGYTAANDSDFIYALDVSQPMPGSKKVAVLLYYHDPSDGPLVVDPRRPNSGLALCLSTLVIEP